jgi:hypothetical protein
MILTFEAWLMLAILIILFGLFVWSKLPTWIVFVGTVTVTMTLRLASAGALLEDFANTGVATVGQFSAFCTFPRNMIQSTIKEKEMQNEGCECF